MWYIAEDRSPAHDSLTTDPRHINNVMVCYIAVQFGFKRPGTKKTWFQALVCDKQLIDIRKSKFQLNSRHIDAYPQSPEDSRGSETQLTYLNNSRWNMSSGPVLQETSALFHSFIFMPRNPTAVELIYFNVTCRSVGSIWERCLKCVTSWARWRC